MVLVDEATGSDAVGTDLQKPAGLILETKETTVTSRIGQEGMRLL